MQLVYNFDTKFQTYCGDQRWQQDCSVPGSPGKVLGPGIRQDRTQSTLTVQWSQDFILRSWDFLAPFFLQHITKISKSKMLQGKISWKVHTLESRINKQVVYWKLKKKSNLNALIHIYSFINFQQKVPPIRLFPPILLLFLVLSLSNSITF